MKKLICYAMVLCLLFLAACSDIQKEETTTKPEETYIYKNQAGPIDEAHYMIGFKALYAIDWYLSGNDHSSNLLYKDLSNYYNEINALPEDAEDSPYKAGNDMVEAYVFLPYSYFQMDPKKLDERLVEGRGYLADAIGVTMDSLVTVGD